MKLEGQVRIPSGCAITGVFARDGQKISGEGMIRAIATMHDRSNGLGGGFAGYGIYPDYKDAFALHVFFDSKNARDDTEALIHTLFDVVTQGRIPTKKMPQITDEPIIRRYFVKPIAARLEAMQTDEKEFVARFVMDVNTNVKGAYIFSSGKNMGVFKAVGFPEDVGRFYGLEDYTGYCWTAHGRYPTNTPGWWGGAHPFSLLDYSVVHNGEISSYDANRRWMEMFGYRCTLQTDTEVITYIIDYLHRKQGLSLEDIANVIAAPFWFEIDAMPTEQREKITYLRNVFSSLLITGPFSILMGFEGGIMALNDRLKLRSMVAAEKGELIYFSSEECAIRALEPNPDRIWSPKGGEPIIATLNAGVV